MIVQLDEAKNFLRVDITDDDAMIQTLITGAESYVKNATGTTFDSTNALAHTICLMLIAQWYTNRENAGQLSNPQSSVLNGLIAQLTMSSSTDIMPPEAPVGLNGEVDENDYAWLRWLLNTEPNVSGYNVYRDGVKLNTELVRRRLMDKLEYWVWEEFVPVPPETPPGVVGYRDATVVAGQTYSYQVTAVDTLGNESVKSAAVQVTP